MSYNEYYDGYHDPEGNAGYASAAVGLIIFRAVWFAAGLAAGVFGGFLLWGI